MAKEEPSWKGSYEYMGGHLAVQPEPAIPPDDKAREAIYAEIRDAAPQLMDAMLSRLTEILWPNGKFHNPSEAFKRPLRFYPDDTTPQQNSSAEGHQEIGLGK